MVLRKLGVCGKGKAWIVVLERSARRRGRWKIEPCIFCKLRNDVGKN
jgi:hypothetical protein